MKRILFVILLLFTLSGLTGCKRYDSENLFIFEREIEDGVEYTSIEEIKDKNKKVIRIPKKVDYLPVKEIWLWGDYEKVQEIHIPDTVDYISLSGFSGLKAIKVANKNKEFSSKNGVLYNKDKTELIQYPAAKKGKTFKIPSSVESIGYSAFTDSKYLEKITVDKKNANFTSEDGVLYNKNKTELLYYPQSKKGSTFTIPSSVGKIGSWAFEGNKYLTTVIIPNSVRRIESGAFDDIETLEYIIIPSQVNYIGWNIFSGSDNVTVFCEIDKQPSNWSTYWNSSGRRVYWSGEWKLDSSGKPVRK